MRRTPVALRLTNPDCFAKPFLLTTHLATGMLRGLSSYYAKDANGLHAVRLAQGLLHAGKGLLTLAPYHSDRQLLAPPALASLLALLLAGTDGAAALCGPQVRSRVHLCCECLGVSSGLALRPHRCLHCCRRVHTEKLRCLTAIGCMFTWPMLSCLQVLSEAFTAPVRTTIDIATNGTPAFWQRLKVESAAALAKA